MATLDGDLWRHNFIRVRVLDVTSDYETMQSPLPADFYPVIREAVLPVQALTKQLLDLPLADGFLYDWHQVPVQPDREWVVGAVKRDFVHKLLGRA